MKLIYYQNNKNFGDALNPMIFNKFLPGFFDEDESSIFLGIGSILQFSFPNAKHKIVFSSGFAYGELPEIDHAYDVQCVRGPLTAAKLGLAKKLAITDGAALLRAFDWPVLEKKHKCAFMPHHESAHFFDWKKICEEVGYHYIDPLGDTNAVLKQILESELIVAEAMHGAIVADTLRVPWIPVKFYKTINEFKWNDWTSSLKLDYKPTTLDPLYNKESIARKISARFEKIPNFLLQPGAGVYGIYQDVFLQNNIVSKFAQLKFSRSFLSEEKVLDEKVEQLIEKTRVVQSKYERICKI